MLSLVLRFESAIASASLSRASRVVAGPPCMLAELDVLPALALAALSMLDVSLDVPLDAAAGIGGGIGSVFGVPGATALA